MALGRERDGDAAEHESDEEHLEREREPVWFVARQHPGNQGPRCQAADVRYRAHDPSAPGRWAGAARIQIV